MEVVTLTASIIALTEIDTIKEPSRLIGINGGGYLKATASINILTEMIVLCCLPHLTLTRSPPLILQQRQLRYAGRFS